jgi:hypothetical protein
LVELPLLERIKRCQNLTAADIGPSPSHHTPYTGTYIDGIRIKRFVFDTSRH